MEDEQNIEISSKELTEEKNIELRSEEVQEILGSPPKWIVRWGTSLAAMVVFILLFVAWLVKYPEIVAAQLTLTTRIPPSPLVARVDANIEKIFVLENELVTKDQLLTVLQSTGQFEDVLMLEEELDELKEMDESEIVNFQPDRTLALGELQRPYSTLLEYFETYDRGESTDYVQQSVARLLSSKRTIQDAIQNEKNKLTDIQLELENALIDQDRIKQLYVKNIYSKRDLEIAQNKVLKVKGRIKQVKSVILSKQQELISLDEQIARLQNEKEVSSDANFVKLREEINRLQSRLDEWKQQYLLFAPVDGRIAFNGLVKENQFVKKGTTLLRIIPEENREWIGRVELPTFGSGKVEIGQRVVVKFNNYNFEEYGVVEGVVKSKSILPSGDTYNLEVEFPHGLKTSYHKTIPYKPEMQGTAEIITDRKRFLRWLFDKLMAKVEGY